MSAVYVLALTPTALQIILAGLAFLTLRSNSDADFVLVIDSGSTGTRM